MRGWRARVALLAFWALVAASVAAALAALGWPFELFAHFRPQYAVAALVLAATLLWLRLRRAALLAALLALLHAGSVVPRVVAAQTATRCTGPPITIVTANLWFRNRDPQRFLNWIAAHPADVVVIQELNRSWATSLAQLEGYPYRLEHRREDPYGIAVLSRTPVDGIALEDFAGDRLPSLAGRLHTSAGEIYFIGLHTHWPLTPVLMERRDRVLTRVAVRIRTQAMPVILAGDLNATPGSPVFTRLLAESGLRDALSAIGWRPTWLAGFWPLALPIDHVLASPGFCVDAAQVGPSIGSDHRPVWVRLRRGPAR